MSAIQTHHRTEVDPIPLGPTDGLEAGTIDTSTYNMPTQSLNSSVSSHVFENGRRYHAYYGQDKNPMPTDETEQDRLDLHHEIILILLNGELYLAPVMNPQRILDIGTGTGIWAIDAADKYPSAQVIGTDLSPIQPVCVIPSNCHFEVDDSELDWIYPEDWFDLIHIRNIAQGISDWPKLLAQAYRTVKPGGYVELGELSGSLHADDDSMPDTHPTKIAFDLFETAMEQSGRPKVAWEVMEANMKEAGFVDIMVVSKKQPFGPWPRDPILKKVGAMVLMMMHTGVEAYGMMLFTKVLGMEVDEARKVCTDCLSGIKQKNSHLYNYFYTVYGRKPEQTTSTFATGVYGSDRTFGLADRSDGN